MRIARNRLNVSAGADLRSFYCDLLGMKVFASDDALIIGYDDRQCLLEFRQGDFAPFYDGGDGFYWKIGITLRDLDAAVSYLRDRGSEVSDPRQFLDIGYLCHLRDPNGFPIELLQQGFEGNEEPLPTPDGHPIASQATLAHVTLRITDLAAAKQVCEERLGMRLMSVQPVELPNLKFSLYFYAWSGETLPNANLEAVGNREWLWARPYSLLELQHLENAAGSVRTRKPHEAGFDGLGFMDDAGRLTYVSAEELSAGQ
jgi:catechol 2,3-dioxygenase-like lactoylglutathione lyase family enzyme/predicted enzyme related to lactoylglutathione lyase